MSDASSAAAGFAIEVVAAMDPVDAFWKPSVAELVVDRPLSFVLAAALGLAITVALGQAGAGDE